MEVFLKNFHPKYKAKNRGILISTKYTVRDDGQGQTKRVQLTACQEIRGIELPEYFKPVNQDEQGSPEHSPE